MIETGILEAVFLIGIGFWLGFAMGGSTGFRAALIANEVNADKEAHKDGKG